MGESGRSKGRAPARTGDRKTGKRKTGDGLGLVADVLVIGGGPAGAWAALRARNAGAEVILADKGFLGTSGATAPSNTETWLAAPGEARSIAVARHLVKTGGLSDAVLADRVLDGAWRGLNQLVDWSYPFPRDDLGQPYLGNLRGPDYMRFMRRRVIGARVKVLDHHPALELLGDADGVAGAAGIDRQRGIPWTVRASAVVLATGGCAFGERFLGATGLTGDGYLMAAEAGAELTGMEMSSQYAVVPAGSSVNKGMPFRWATFFDADGGEMGELGDDRQLAVAMALRKGPVRARLDKAGPREREWLRQAQANCFLPFDRAGIDPFEDMFEVHLRCEGTVRGLGGIRLVSEDCATDVPGLYAAGDAASREAVMGAITGGGGPNSSWAIASGSWAGAAAGRFAVGQRARRDLRYAKGLGGAGMRVRSSGLSGTSPAGAEEIRGAVRAEMLPLERNFFRSGDGLSRSLKRLDGLWRDLRNETERPVRTLDADIARRREAAALLMTSRRALASAIQRRETRGMHRRGDFPSLNADAPRRLAVRGLDTIEVRAGVDATEAGP
jgi:succinate dehydrogenase/fumarate reductase flavoprotein subunit